MIEKDIFKIIKYFKSIYTSINNEDEIYISNNIFLYKPNPFYIIYGKLQDDSNAFSEWIKEKSTVIKMSEINNLRACLKKDVISVQPSENSFSLNYTDKDMKNIFFICTNEINKNYQRVIDKIKDINSKFVKEFSIDDILLEDELFTIYLGEENEITSKPTNDKIIEIPSKRILSIQKNSKKLLKISNKDQDGKRFVQLSSITELLEICQIFATI